MYEKRTRQAIINVLKRASVIFALEPKLPLDEVYQGSGSYLLLNFVGIKCDDPCKKFLERGQCTTKWRRRCIRTCLALGCDEEEVRPEGEKTD